MAWPAIEYSATMGSGGSAVKVFVMLAHGFDARLWEERWHRDEVLGVNERSPYGYHHANDMGAVVSFSQDAEEGMIGKFVRLAFRVLLGYDLIHAFRNLKGLRDSDVIWTHTESQSLAVLTLFPLLGAKRPKLVSQSVWLIDRWERLGFFRRALYRRLIRRADLMTFLSPLNAARAEQLFPGTPVAFVPYGICSDGARPVTSQAPGRPLKIVALGNDEHRDWRVLIETVNGRDRYSLKIATGRDLSALKPDPANIEIGRPSNNIELVALYEWADVVCVPLKPNLHASGITVVQEAVLQGKPVICTAVGGLDAYFSDDEVTFIPGNDGEALERAFDTIAGSPEPAWDRVRKARAKMLGQDLSSRSYVRRHVELSRALLGDGVEAV